MLIFFKKKITYLKLETYETISKLLNTIKSCKGADTLLMKKSVTTTRHKTHSSCSVAWEKDTPTSTKTQSPDANLIFK
jgi:hypothetical protein